MPNFPTCKLCFFDILYDDISWNKMCVYLIGHFKIPDKGRYNLLVKAVTMINPMTLWF